MIFDSDSVIKIILENNKRNGYLMEILKENSRYYAEFIVFLFLWLIPLVY